MSTTVQNKTLRVRRTQLAWRIPHVSKAVEPAPGNGYAAIGTAYAESPASASPAKSLLGALTATVVLYVSVGALALPAAAFA